jgi:flagellar biosynthesis chaperone FliJ
MRKIGLVIAIVLCLSMRPGTVGAYRAEDVWRRTQQAEFDRPLIERAQQQRELERQQLLNAIQSAGQGGPAMQQYVMQLEQRIVQLEAAVNRHEQMLQEAGRQLGQIGQILEEQNRRLPPPEKNQRIAPRPQAEKEAPGQ